MRTQLETSFFIYSPVSHGAILYRSSMPSNRGILSSQLIYTCTFESVSIVISVLYSLLKASIILYLLSDSFLSHSLVSEESPRLS